MTSLYLSAGILLTVNLATMAMVPSFASLPPQWRGASGSAMTRRRGTPRVWARHAVRPRNLTMRSAPDCEQAESCSLSAQNGRPPHRFGRRAARDGADRDREAVAFGEEDDYALTLGGR